MPHKPHILPRPTASSRSRPSWLQALGKIGPPLEVWIDGEPFTQVDLFKHDSWAATALYRGPEGATRLVKFHRTSSLFGVPMGWFGRLAARHEAGVLHRLRDLDGVPRLCGPVDGAGHRLRNAVARTFIAGHPLRRREPVGDGFFPALRQLIEAMHVRHITYVDLHKRENVIVGEEGGPHLIDFQISVIWPRGPLMRPLERLFRDSDLYHLMKHWAGCRPDQCGFDTAALRRRLPIHIRAHRLIALPFRELRRRLLVLLGVRTGKGRVETERFAEESLRSGTSA